jgi:hypothetical protein
VREDRCASLFRGDARVLVPVLRSERRKLRDEYRMLPLVGQIAVNEAVKVSQGSQEDVNEAKDVARIVAWRDLRPLAQGEG